MTDMTPPPKGSMVLYDYALPPLKPGSYRFQVSGQIEAGSHEHEVANERHFVVDGPRFVLNPGDIASVCPPSNAQGPFGSVLPQIVMRRRTLPWERDIAETLPAPSNPKALSNQQPDYPTPWFALLLLQEGEDYQIKPGVPLEQVLLRQGGFKKLLTAFNTQRCLNPSISLGLAEGAFEEAIGYVKERTIRGQAVASFQGIQWKLAEMYRDIEAGRSLLYRACLSANPFPDPHEAAIAKMFVNEMAIRVVSEALQVHGGYGFTDDAAISRFYRGVRYGTLGGGATEALKDLVGRKLVDDFDPVDGFLSMGTF